MNIGMILLCDDRVSVYGAPVCTSVWCCCEFSAGVLFGLKGMKEMVFFHRLSEYLASEFVSVFAHNNMHVFICRIFSRKYSV